MEIRIGFVLDKTTYLALLITQLIVYVFAYKVALVSSVISFIVLVILKYVNYDGETTLFDEKLILSIITFGAFTSGVVILSSVNNFILQGTLLTIFIMIELIVSLLTTAMYLLNKNDVGLVMEKRKRYDMIENISEENETNEENESEEVIDTKDNTENEDIKPLIDVSDLTDTEIKDDEITIKL